MSKHAHLSLDACDDQTEYNCNDGTCIDIEKRFVTCGDASGPKEANFVVTVLLF